MKKQWIKEIGMIIVGNLILAYGVAAFILPYDILSGGIAGIAVAISPLIPLDKGLIVAGLEIALFITGWLFLGTKFASKTVLSSILYPTLLNILTTIVHVPAIDPVLASLYGGAIAGLGIGIVLRAGTSTGGMDIPPLIIHKLTGIKVSVLVVVTDILTVLLGMATFGFDAVLVGFISVISSGFMIDKVLMFGGSQSKSVQIISEHYDSIMKVIHEKFDRGCTIYDATGGYTGKERKVLLVVVSSNEYNELINEVNQIDPNAFIITTDVTSVHGEGFSLQTKV